MKRKHIVLGGLILLMTLLAGAAIWWVSHALTQKQSIVDVDIEPHTSPRGVAQAVVDAGVDVDPDLLLLWFRLSGKSRGIKSGSYQIIRGSSPYAILQQLVRGDEALRYLRISEGWSMNQVRQALEKSEFIKQETAGLTDAQLMTKLGKPGISPEGRFFPDTYTYTKGVSDLTLLTRALKAMDKRLTAAWEKRSGNLPYKTIDEALIMASLIEKETGKASDRPMVSGVFSNRLKVGMRLQTDPTVIYGMGANYTGKLRRSDLQVDTPYNTYTRAGLPPTPIAMPGKASLYAAVQPADTKALYFVARGDGSSQFSDSLEEHNMAVNKYIRGQ